MRRWTVGDLIEVEGLVFRVVQGKKAPDDLRLEVWIDTQWIPVPMSWGWLMADFFYENEDVLYPPPARGGKYYLGAVHQAVRQGWRVVYERLQDEKRNKATV